MDLRSDVEILLLDRFEDYAGRDTLLFRPVFEEKLQQHGEEFHAIMGRNLLADDVKDAVMCPDVHCRSLTDPQIIFYYKRLTDRYYIRVVVVEPVDSGKINSIISFHPRTSIVGLELWQRRL